MISFLILHVTLHLIIENLYSMYEIEERNYYFTSSRSSHDSNFILYNFKATPSSRKIFINEVTFPANKCIHLAYLN